MVVPNLTHGIRIQADGTLEKERMLWHGDDLAPDLLPWELGHINPVNADGTPLHVHKTEKRHDEGGLAAAGPPAHTDLFPGLDGQIDLLQNHVVTAILMISRLLSHSGLDEESYL